MAKGISYDAPGHDPIYGIRRSNIATRLTNRNWNRKATCRIDKGGCLYILVVIGERWGEEQKRKVHHVAVDRLSGEGPSWSKDFETLDEALAYANGEDSSDFAHATYLANDKTYPLNNEPDIYFHGRPGNGVPGFTTRIPGRTWE